MDTLDHPSGAAVPELPKRRVSFDSRGLPVGVAWARQAVRARERALCLLRSGLDGDAAGNTRDEAAAESAAVPTELYLIESDRLFDLTWALMRPDSV